MKTVVAAVSLPRLPSEVARVDDREACGIIIDDEESDDFVLRSVLTLADATDAARAMGVKPGQRLIDAQRYAPMLRPVVVPRSKILAELRTVAEVLLNDAPAAEPIATRSFVVALDISGMVKPVERIAADVKRACTLLGHRACVAVSPKKRLSIGIARDQALRGGPPLVFARDVDVALQHLHIDALELSTDLSTTLFALGVKTAGDLAKLGDIEGVLRPFGSASEPVVSVQIPERVIEQEDLEHPILSLEPLLFLLRKQAARLCMRARARGCRIGEVAVSLAPRKAEPTVVRVGFPDPILDDKALVRALQVKLERTELTAPVDKLLLEATQLVQRGPRQLPLDPKALVEVQTQVGVESLIAEMSAELGSDRVGCLVVTDDPRPERMTNLRWPAPPPPEPLPAPRRRRPRKRSIPITGGRFLASWPWPLRLLPKPMKCNFKIVHQALLGVIEGEDASDAVYAREYRMVVLDDGRRALGIWDNEVEELWIQGWFD
jgi:hypothetical protein